MQPLGQERARIVGVVTFYFVVSISMVYLNKFLMEAFKFEYPLFLTWVQQVVSMVGLLLFSLLGTRVQLLAFSTPPECNKKLILGILPLTCVYVGMLSFNNLCLKYVAVWFYQVARSLTVVFSIVFTYTFLNTKTSLAAMKACAVVILGFLIGAYGKAGVEAPDVAKDDVAFLYQRKLVGVIFGVMSSVFVALYSTYVKMKLPLVNNSEWLLLNYNTAFSVVLLPPLILAFGEYPALLSRGDVLGSTYFWVTCVITGIFGFAISLAMFMQIKYTSPLTNTISGTAKACVQTVLAVILWHSEINLTGVLGVVLVIGGSFWYSMIRHWEMANRVVEPVLPVALPQQKSDV
eukprot:TRINITY_DN4977_c0_g1_i4.p1 TRINITY_DN4977_c0_g1~~TRINITY_DN4977_c0_g1_i4.p1  ORF type:complete len:357 (+),score=124.39 TRINITY_DN4977_c0_g1_i4:28-1071(+)